MLGSTPKPLFKKLIEHYKQGKVSFRNVKFFNMDEYVGYAPENPESFQRFLWENLFDHVDVDLKNVHLLNGDAENPDEECRRYEEKIKEVGGIDLLIGGKKFSASRRAFGFLPSTRACGCGKQTNFTRKTRDFPLGREACEEKRIPCPSFFLVLLMACHILH